MAANRKSSFNLEWKRSTGYSCQYWRLHLQVTVPRIPTNTKNASIEIVNSVPSKKIDLKYLLLLIHVLTPVLIFSQDSLSVSNPDTMQKDVIFDESVETDSTQIELGDDTTAVIDEPAEPDSTQNQIIAHTILGILPLESPVYSEIEMLRVANYIQKEAETTGKFSTVTTLFAPDILDTLKELGKGCADLDCAYDVVNSANLDQIIVIDLSRMKKTGSDSTGTTTLSGNMILYLISPETEEPEESGDEPKKTARDIPIMVKRWVSDISENTRQILSGESWPVNNRVNRWHRGSTIDVPDILKIMVWELLEEQTPEGYFTDSMLALAQGDIVGKTLTFIAANGAVLAIGGLVLVGGGYAIASSGTADSDNKGFKNPPKLPDVP